MEVITFGPDMDLSSKEVGDVFRLKLHGIEYDVKVVGDDEDPLMFCKDCIFFNDSERCSLSESQDWCLKKQVVYCKNIMGKFNTKDANFLWRQIGRIDGGDRNSEPYRRRDAGNYSRSAKKNKRRYR